MLDGRKSHCDNMELEIIGKQWSKSDSRQGQITNQEPK